MTIYQMFLQYWIKRSNLLFPRLCYLDERDVRHARREWVRAKTYLNFKTR